MQCVAPVEIPIPPMLRWSSTLIWSTIAILNVCLVASFDLATGNPPLLNSPVYVLATWDDEKGTSNMSVVTYASPVSIQPGRLWAIGIYKQTYSYQNFKKSRRGILQLLTPDHIPVIRLLGGSSGRDVDKELECRKLGYEWKQFAKGQPLVLPGCASYICLELQGDLMDGGSHDVAIARVTETFTDSECPHLDTQTLRDLGIITIQGRIADDV